MEKSYKVFMRQAKFYKTCMQKLNWPILKANYWTYQKLLSNFCVFYFTSGKNTSYLSPLYKLQKYELTIEETLNQVCRYGVVVTVSVW